jgi:hypothetical protein
MRPTTTLDRWQSHRALRTILSAIAAPGFSARHENPYPHTRRSARQGADLVSLRTQSRRRFLDRHQRVLDEARWPMLAAGRLSMARDSGDASVRVARATSIPRFERTWRAVVAECALERRSQMRDVLLVTTFGLS